jgi:hypothetical protein
METSSFKGMFNNQVVMTSADGVVVESNKRSKPKRAGQQLHFDILDDVNIKAEIDWETEDMEH